MTGEVEVSVVQCTNDQRLTRVGSARSAFSMFTSADALIASSCTSTVGRSRGIEPRVAPELQRPVDLISDDAGRLPL